MSGAKAGWHSEVSRVSVPRFAWEVNRELSGGLEVNPSACLAGAVRAFGERPQSERIRYAQRVEERRVREGRLGRFWCTVSFPASAWAQVQSLSREDGRPSRPVEHLAGAVMAFQDLSAERQVEFVKLSAPDPVDDRPF